MSSLLLARRYGFRHMGRAGQTGPHKEHHPKDRTMHDENHPLGSKVAAALFALLLSSTVLLSAIGPASAASLSHQQTAASDYFKPALA